MSRLVDIRPDTQVVLLEFGMPYQLEPELVLAVIFTVSLFISCTMGPPAEEPSALLVLDSKPKRPHPALLVPVTAPTSRLAERVTVPLDGGVNGRYALPTE